MENVFLTVREVAELKGCTMRNIRLAIESETLKAETIEVKGNRTRGIQYRIPLSALDKPLQLKYKRRMRELAKAEMTAPAAPIGADEENFPFNFETITAAERKQIAFWKKLIDEWDNFRGTSTGSKAKIDARFVQRVKAQWEKNPPAFDTTLSVVMLYRKRRAIYAEGEAALIDHRGKHGNHARKMTDEMRDIFEYYYLDKSKKTATLCTFLVEEELKRRYPLNWEEIEVPTTSTFERLANKIPIPYVKWFRDGVYAFMAECAPYIKRMYDDLEPNDIWVADGHTFDIMVQGKDGKPIRMYLTAFMDVRTRKMMGWVVTDKLCGDATIYALKKGVEKYGCPKAILTDNGREYLFHDFSGDKVGFRKKAKTKDGEFVPPTILENLGIEMRTAIPKNARAKGIERAFETLKENLSKLFESYTGGNVLEKPDDLKYTVKNPDKMPTPEELTEIVEKYITGFYNKQPHRGEGMNGKSPDEVYAALFYEKRVVPADKLNLMFMRYGKGTMKVGKNGVTLKVYGAELQFTLPEQDWINCHGHDVYVRYSPEDLSSIRVYNTENQFICEAQQDKKLSYAANKEDLQEMQREKHSRVKAVTNYKRVKNVEAQSALDAMLNAAAENLELPEGINPKIISIVQGEFENSALPMAAGAETYEPIDYFEAARRFKEQKLATQV